MDFRYLKAFMTTVEQSSFSKAADELNIAQSAVSRQVKLLEESIQDELLIRSPKHLAPTPKGRRLYEALKRFEEETAALLAEDARQLIRVGILHGLLESWFESVLGAYYEKNDENLQITVGSLQDLRDGLDAGRFDIVFSPLAIESELIVSQPLFDEELAIISQQPIDPERLAEQRCIIYGPEDLLLKLARVMPQRAIQVNSVTAILKLVRRGVGVAVLPGHMVEGVEGLSVYRNPKLPGQTIFASHLRFKKTPEALLPLLELLPRKGGAR